MIDLKQKELDEWQRKNFPITGLLKLPKEELVKIILILQVTLGINEEAGEVAHCVLKGTQRIRGGVGGIDAKEVANGVGDNLIFGMQLLSMLKLEAEKEIPEVIEEVLARDWNTNPENGLGVPKYACCRCDYTQPYELINNIKICHTCRLPVRSDKFK